MANAAFFQHFPLEERYAPHPFPQRADLEMRGFLKPDGTVAPKAYAYWYAGDYGKGEFKVSVLGRCLSHDG